MALTIAIEGKGVIANCDAISDSAGGTWSEQGGGTMSVSTDVFLIGSSCIGGQYASKSGFQQYDLGSGNTLDFTASTGSESGQLLYIWVAMTALGTLDTLSNYGLCIRLSSSSPGTSNYIDYLIAGNDDKNGWAGGFKCFVVDPTLTPSRVSGTQSSIIAAVRTLGVWIDCSSSARADSIFIDQVAVGSGIRVTGTSTEGWKDVVDYCTAYSTRGWGMFQEREGIYYSYGKTYIGSTSQSSATSFQDSDKIIQYGITEYYQGGAWRPTVSPGYSALIVEDASGYATTFEDGVIVGSDNGRSGSTFLGNSQLDVYVDLYGGNNSGSLTKLYGTQFKNLTGSITWGNDSDHLYFGGVVSGCGQFDPVGAVQLRNLIFTGTKDSYGGSNPDGSALLWNSSIDIQNCSFIANSDATYDPHAIQVDAAGSISFNALIFSGNDYDVHFTPASGDLTVSKTNSANPSTSDVEGTGSVSFTASFTHTLTGLAENTEVTYVRVSDGVELFHVENVTATGQTVYTHSGGEVVDILIVHLDYDPDISNIYDLTLPNANASVPIKQIADAYYDNP